MLQVIVIKRQICELRLRCLGLEYGSGSQSPHHIAACQKPSPEPGLDSALEPDLQALSVHINICEALF